MRISEFVRHHMRKLRTRNNRTPVRVLWMDGAEDVVYRMGYWMVVVGAVIMMVGLMEW